MHFYYLILCVAPYAGAWIEMVLTTQQVNAILSHPTRVRGLKWFCAAWLMWNQVVAPYAGAWIEINYCAIVSHYILSHPTRVRGLK